MQHEIKKNGPLLNEKGILREPGFARTMLLDYDRKAIHASSLRIKEWDYYLIQSDNYALALTIADNGYMGLDSISLLELDIPREKTVSKMSLLPMGKRKLPASSRTGDISVKEKTYEITFENNGYKRRLYGHMDHFAETETLFFDITLSGIPSESMVIATPFSENKYSFYYNQKINCMTADGNVVLGDREFLFAPAHSTAVLDWGRGVWPYRNTWYWGSLSSRIDGIPFGFNIGYGFGDTSAASENVLFYNGLMQKLDRIKINIPQADGRDDFLSQWTISSSDDRLVLNFVPLLDRSAKMNALILCSDQHQVFGKFYGKAILDDGKEITLNGMTGFVEKVYNKW